MLNEASPESVRSVIQADGHFTFIRHKSEPPLTPDGQHVVRVASSDWLQCPSGVSGRSRLSTFHLDSGLSMQAVFFLFFPVGGNQSKEIPTSCHVSQRAPNSSTSLLSHTEWEMRRSGWGEGLDGVYNTPVHCARGPH
jgi:hypothetical protein